MTQEKILRVLVAEDSALFAESLVGILESSGDIRVVGVAVDGARAVALTRELRPDVVLMDVRMPVLGGLDAVQVIMEQTPTPILVTTADPGGRTGTLAFEALRRGALELVPKPLTWMGTETEQDELREKIRLLARIPVLAQATKRRPGSARTQNNRRIRARDRPNLSSAVSQLQDNPR